MEAGARETDRRRHCRDGRFLTLDAGAENVFEVEESSAVATLQSCSRDAGHLGQDAGDVVAGDASTFAAGFGALGTFFRELLLQLGQDRVAEFTRALVVAPALRVLELEPPPLELLADSADLFRPLALGAPRPFHLVGVALEDFQFAFDRGTALGRRCLGVLSEGRELDLERRDRALQGVELLGRGFLAEPERRRSFVDEIDGLWGESETLVSA